MPIDFNPHFFQVPNNIQQKMNAQSSIAFRQKPDTFVKTVSINENGVGDYTDIKISEKPFGTIQKTGETATLYTITNKNGASVDLSNFGAAIISIKVPDKKGNLVDVTQGYDSVTPYETAPVGHAGGTIGPCANKIDNGEFNINGEVYTLEKNKDNGRTHCHGASEGFDIKTWDAKSLPDDIEII